MRSPKHWFGLGPYDEYQGYQYHWYNKYYEWYNERVRFMIGDLLARDQVENGGDPMPRFLIDVAPLQGDMESEFYLPDNPKAHFDIHILNVVFWRWGIYLSIRGRIQADA
jgi:hypothetical protein